MNLSEALDAALPTMPIARATRTRLPRMDPDMVVREDVVDGEPVFAIMQRSTNNFFRLPAAQWQLATLFDGIRAFDEIAELYTAQTGIPATYEDVRVFADALEDANFWYKSPQERNLALEQKLMGQRERRAARKSKFNVTHVTFSAWDPDRYFTWLDGAVGKYIYSPWFVLAVVLLFAFEATVFIAQWGVIGPDAKLYYNFTHKSLLDLAQFWVLFLILGFLHESAHGLTCKHFGGQVHAMGLMFMYLMPAFYCDVTEVWVSANKVQRLATIIAGIWTEMTVCGLAMIVWTNTLPGVWVHDSAYQVILITGLAVILINLNPLIKLDGYYFLTESIEIPDLKERSTTFLSGWFQNRVLRLPVEIPVVARKRAPFFVFYAIASGAYSYMLLFFVIRFSYNVLSHWFAEFALIPAGALAFYLFRSRLRALRDVAKRFWEHHFASGAFWHPRYLVVAVLLAALLFLPLWRDREDAWYVIESARANTVHAAVPGRVNAVWVHQGETVRAGQPLLGMSSSMAASMHSSADAQAGNARFEAVSREMQGGSIGTASALEDASASSSRLASEAQSSLVVAAPADGIVLTQDPNALLGQAVGSGQSLLDLADTGPRIARIYIPVSALNRIPPGAEVALALPGRFSIVRAALPPPGGDAVPLPQGLIATQDYRGVTLPDFYCSRIPLPASAGNPPLGLAGKARIFGARRSLAERAARILVDLVKAHVW